MKSRIAPLLVVVLGVAGCAETGLSCEPGHVENPDGDCVIDPVDSGVRVDSGPDSGPPDGGIDAAVVCDPECGGEEQFCVDGQCVQCRDTNDCSAEQGQCVDGTCTGCTSDDHCAGRTDGRNVCHQDSGECVECTLGSDACDDGQTCNLLTSQCVDIVPGSREICEPCTNDLQCADGAKCVPLQYKGSPHEPAGPGSGYCLQPAPPEDPCPRPYTTVLARETVNNPLVEGVYCGIDENLSTCEAVLALFAEQPCAAGMDRDCPEGGICRTSAGVGSRCTYACDADSDCLDKPNEDTCRTGTGTDRYCGP